MGPRYTTASSLCTLGKNFSKNFKNFIIFIATMISMMIVVIIMIVIRIVRYSIIVRYED